MYITNIVIKNFRNIHDITLSPAQVNILSGDNGSGKSSILYALMYALTDKLPEKLSNYIRWNTDEFMITVSFRLYNKNYTLTVIHDGNKTKKELHCLEDIHVYYNSDATKYLQSLINTNIIYYSLFSEQGKTAQILFDTPANRLKKLKEILQIDEIEQLQDIIKSEIQEYKNNIIQYETELKLLQSKQYIFKNVPDLSMYEGIEDEYLRVKEKKDVYDVQLQKYNEYCLQLKDYENFINLYNRITIRKNDIENALQKFKDIEKIKKDKITYSEELTKLKKLRDDIIIAESIISSFENDIVKKKNEIATIVIRRLQPCKYTEEQKQDVYNKLLQVQYEIKDIDNQIGLIKQGKCPTCKRPFDDIHLQDYIIQKENLQNQHIELSSMYETISTTLSHYEKNKKEYEYSLQKKNELENSINELQNKIATGKEKYKNYSLPDIEKQVVEYEKKLQEIENYIIEYNSLYSQLQSLEKELSTFTVIDKPHEVQKPEVFDEEYFVHVQNKKLQYEKEKAMYDAIVEYNTSIQKEKEQDNKRKNELQKLYEEITQKIDQLKQSQDILLKMFPSYLIDKGSEFLKDTMNNFFMNTYGKYEITFSQDKNSIDFYYGTNNIYAPCAVASGYEKSCLALALRVALASFIPQCKVLVLDEIDSDASSENSVRFYQSLLQYLPDYQFFIVTHNDETKEFLLQNYNSNFYTIQNGQIVLQ